MNKIFLIVLLLLNVQVIFGQNMDFTSIDEFFKISCLIKQGKDISVEQWQQFEQSRGYKDFAERENKFLIQTIKASIQTAFGNNPENERSRIMNLPEEEISGNEALMMEKLILINYLDIKQNYANLKVFRDNYDFNSLHTKAVQRLSTFLKTPIDTTVQFKPIYFLFLSSDGKDAEDALYIDLNLIYNMTEQQRVDFIAHEFFHNYRRYFENHDFNYKNDLNFMLDMIQNEGIADQIDKSEGYDYYFSEVCKSPVSQIMIQLYNQAETDLEKIHNIVVSYSVSQISEDGMIDKLLEVYRFNGHAIGFYMSSQIIKAGYEDDMVKNFYNPYKFYTLYNLAAKKNGTFLLGNEFMEFMRNRTEKHYR